MVKTWRSKRQLSSKMIAFVESSAQCSIELKLNDYRCLCYKKWKVSEPVTNETRFRSKAPGPRCPYDIFFLSYHSDYMVLQQSFVYARQTKLYTWKMFQRFLA